MAKTLLEEIFNQLTGRKSKRSRNTHRTDKVYERMKFEHEKALFENKKNMEIMKLKAKSKGWL